jgi:chitodextrinase
MKKYTLLFTIGLLFVVPFLSHAQPCTTMYVKGRYLYTAAGEKVTLRGVNEMFIYSNNDKQGATTFPQIAKTNANVVRIVWNTSGSPADLDALLSNCINNKMIPMVQLDDITAKYNADITKLPLCTAYWLRSDVMNAIQKYSKWVLLNIANEAGDNGTSASTFQSYYNTAVTQLRQANYKMPLVIDAPGWGNDEAVLSASWANILANDPQKNCIFSLHTYWKDTNQSNLLTRFNNIVTKSITDNVVFIIGEGPQQKGWDCSTSFPYQSALQTLQANEIGWLAWTWGAVEDGTYLQSGKAACKVSNVNMFNVTTNGIFGNYYSGNSWGKDIVNNLIQYSIRPNSLKGIIDVTAPTAPSALTKSNVTGNSLTLTWAASTDDFAVASYDVYYGTTVINTTANSINLTGLNCNTVYSFTVRSKDCAGNTAVSTPLSVTTGACDTTPPIAPTNLTASGITQNATTLAWGASTDNVGVAGYYIYQGSSTTPINSTAITTTSYSVSGLNCGTAYTYYVVAKDAANNSSPKSNVVSVNTLACSLAACDVVYNDNLLWNSTAAASWGLSSTPYNMAGPAALPQGSSSMRVDYTSGAYGAWVAIRNTVLAPSSNCVLKFSIYGASGVINQMALYAQSLANGGTTGITVLFDAKPNVWTEYTFTLAQLGLTTFQRLNFKNNTANATSVNFDNIRFEPNGTTVVDTTPPIAPTNLTASGITQNAITLAWGASTDNVGVAGYYIYQGSSTTPINSMAITTTSYSVSGLNCGTAYTYYVVAKDAANNSSPKNNVLTINTLACPPTPGEIVYADNTNPIWYNPSLANDYSATRSNVMSPVSEGSASMKVDYAAWGGVQFTRNAMFLPNANTILKFWIYSTGTNKMSVLTNAATGNSVSSTEVFFYTQTGWKEITVNMSDLGSPVMIQRIDIKNSSANALAVYLDNIRFYAVPSSDISAPSSPTLTVTSVTPYIANLSWTPASDNVGVSSYQLFMNGNFLGLATPTITTFQAPLICGNNIYSIYVKALDAVGNSANSNAISVTSLACPPPDITVYDEILSSGWELKDTSTGANWYWSLSSVPNLTSTFPTAYSGSYSTKIDCYGWGALSIAKKTTAHTTTSATVLKFAVYPTTSTTIEVYTDANKNVASTPPSNSFKVTPPVGVWTEYTLSLAQLGNPSQIQRVTFKNYTANNATLYYDKIRFAGVNGARVGVEGLGVLNEDESIGNNLTLFPNPSSGVVLVRYVAKQAENLKIDVVDLTGRTIKSVSEKAVEGQNIFTIDLKFVSDGLHLIKLSGENETLMRKVMIQK